jgi:large subunit ribosomal protein L9
MKVVLRADVPNVGKRGDIIDTSDGFARNYLLRRDLAIVANDGIVAQAAAMRRSRDVKDARDRDAGRTIASKLVPMIIKIEVRAGAGGRLFGAVTSADVVQAVASQAGIEIDRKRIQLAEPIKSVGQHQIPVKLHSDVEFNITLDVVAA